MNDPVTYPFLLQKIEEALGHRIVMAVAASAHRVNQFVVLDERGPGHAGELRTLIRMNQHLVLRFASPHRRAQSLQYDVHGLSALHRPADDPVRIEIDDDHTAWLSTQPLFSEQTYRHLVNLTISSTVQSPSGA